MADPGIAPAYKAELAPLNNSNGSGTVTIALTGTKAVITESVDKMPGIINGQPYPHLQHLNAQGSGQCPTMAADTNHDGIVSAKEGMSSYGPVATTLSTEGDTSPKAMTNLATAPHGQKFSYTRTIDLDAQSAEALKAGKAVVVIDGVDLASVSGKARSAHSEMTPSLPLAETAPALCGVLAAVPAAAGSLPGAPDVPGAPNVPAPGVPKGGPDLPNAPDVPKGPVAPGGPADPSGGNPDSPGGTAPGGPPSGQTR